MAYRFHLLGLVHLPVSKRFEGCAFTQKIVKFADMMMSLGHEVILYGAETSDAPCTRFVQTHTLNDIRKEWGDGDNRYELGYDWKKEGFRHDFNSTETATKKKFNLNCIAKIQETKEDDDFLVITQGVYQKQIADSVGLYLTVENGVGYRGSFTNFKAFESSYLMNFTYGSQDPFKSVNGRYYDRVIPNYYDERDWDKVYEERDDYYLYIGRVTELKGVYTALKTCAAIGAKLVIAGQGSLRMDGFSNYEIVGYVDGQEKRDLMGRAKAVFVPSVYLEAFGGVNVEAQLCGTPVITTNFGVFPETVIHGWTGFRCNTLNDFVEAARNVGCLNPQTIRAHATRYLMCNVKHEFQKWFDDLYQVYLSTKGAAKGWHHIEV